jgi:phage virion morphogenesis protein
MIKVEFNAAPVFAALKRAGDALEDLAPLHEEIGEYIVDATKRRFVEGKAPDGTAWAPKRPGTIARYEAQGDRGRTRPLIGPSGRLGREIAMLASSDAVEIGSSLEYSGVMQDGAAKGAFGTNRAGRPIPWGAIPARVWLGLSETNEREIVDMADDYVGDAFGG